MTPQDKAIYFAHQRQRTAEEHERVALQRQENRSYRQMLIDDILSRRPQDFTCEELTGKSLRTLELIYDY